MALKCVLRRSIPNCLNFTNRFRRSKSGWLNWNRRRSRLNSPSASLAARPRRTLAAPTARWEGVGLHSGADASICVLPAPPGTGVVFRDLGTGLEIKAIAENVFDTARCTWLKAGEASVQTVEHLLSALAALNVTDAVIESSGGEVPAADGSAAPFVRLLSDVGICEQLGTNDLLTLTEPVFVTAEDGSAIAAIPSDTLRVTVTLHYPQYEWIGTQAAHYDSSTDDYLTEIAPARTFGFLREIDWLRANGLGLGASYENALVLREDGYDGALRFANELARHKVLDVIGDLSLIGRPLAAHVLAFRPSHTLNVRLARLLRAGIGRD